MSQLSEQTRLPAHEHPFYSDMPFDTLTFIAHRGGDGSFENTLEAFDVAVEQGVKFIETDVNCTNDGVAILFHGDKKTARIIEETPFLEINTPKTHKLLGVPEDKDATILAVEEVLTEYPDTKFFLDLKSDKTPIPVVDAIKNAHAQDRVSIDGHIWKRTAEVAEQIPEVSLTTNPIGLLAVYSVAKRMHIGSATMLKTPGIRELRDHQLKRATSLSLPMRWPVAPLFEMANELRIPVFAHQVETEEDAERAAALGARGIMTDKLSLIGHSAMINAPTQPLVPAEALRFAA